MLSKFVNLSRLSPVFVMATGLSLFNASASAQQLNDCDLNTDGAVNVSDLQLAIDMDASVHSVACATTIDGGVCDDNLVSLVRYSILNNTCHTVTLSWTASTTPGVTYNVYRRTPGGSYTTKLNSVVVGGTSYIDATSTAGQTYFYVIRAVDSTNTESANSSEVQAIIPSP
jgi:hypothetical protein